MPEPLTLWIMEDFASRPDAVLTAIRTRLRRPPRVKLTVLTWSETWAAVTQAFKQGRLPDVLQVGTTWLVPFVRLGALRPWPDAAPPSDDNPLAAYLAGTVLDGYRWALPWTVDLRFLYSRDPRPPATVEDWEATLDATRPWVLPGQPEPSLVQAWAMWCWGHGVEIWPEDGRFEAAWKPAVDHLFAVAKRGGLWLPALDMGATEASEHFFARGHGACMIAGFWNSGMNPDITRHVFPPGAVPDDIFLGGSYLGVTTRVPLHPDAFRVAEALTSTEAQALLAESTSVWPADLSVSAERIADIRRLLPALIRRGRSLPPVPQWRYGERLLARTISTLLHAAVAGDRRSATRAVSQLDQEMSDVQAVIAL
jgi:ABC-type glycerol-3-phosphate transport system substrate-binding protein